MIHPINKLCGTLTTIWLLFVTSATSAQPSTPTMTPAGVSDRWIIKRHSHSATRPQLIAGRKQMQRIRSDDDGFELYVGNADDTTLKQLRDDPDVAYVVPDRWRHAHAVANDALFSDQWYLQNTQPAAIAASLAWDTTPGSNGVVVAVLDTGISPNHPDLLPVSQGGRVLPGFDFVSGESTSSFMIANDGDGWDADATDPGDWISADDLNRSDKFYEKCGDAADSSWHGTRVAGLIAATSNNIVGISGATLTTYILPVRVLGKCGGRDADILQALRWAAGIHISGVVDNPNPAKIINMSLGAAGACSQAYADVILQLTQMGVVVVVSAGNEGGPVDEPGNCPGTLTVAGLRHIGTKVGYSSLGPEVSIAAPAGNCVNFPGECLFSLVTTTDSGKTAPVGGIYTDHFATANLGTSFSAPLAASVAALMQSVNSKLTPAQLIKRMQQGSRAFPTSNVAACHIPTGAADLQQNECTCTTSTCGAGMLDAPGAVNAAKKPIVYIAPPTSFAPGGTVTLDGASSTAACNRTITSYGWSVLSTNGATSPTITNATQSAARVTAPTTGSFTLRLTVTDDAGASDTSDVQVSNSSAITNNEAPLSAASCPSATAPGTSPASVPTTPAPPAASGGGGDFNWLLFAALVCLTMAQTCAIKEALRRSSPIR